MPAIMELCRIVGTAYTVDDESYRRVLSTCTVQLRVTRHEMHMAQCLCWRRAPRCLLV
ncbi:uncharacterized protein DS421_16g535930 [Arachis hypogaea]|nr:uncharacterized protein DS421_16g535930 [Arachis hypogaea]